MLTRDAFGRLEQRTRRPSCLWPSEERHLAGTTLALIALGTAAAGIGISAVGQVKAGNAAKRAGDYNAAALEAQADDALVRGEEDVSRFQTQVRQLIGTQRASLAAQNLEIGSGSALDVQNDARVLAARDIDQLRANAAREAWGMRTAAEGERRGGQAAQSASRWGAASTAVGGAGSLLMNTYGWQREGR